MGLMTLANAAPQTAQEPTRQVEYWSRQLCAAALIEDLADWHGVPSETIWGCLCEVADDQLWLLDSPSGWSALGSFVGARLGAPCLPYHPQVH